MSSPSLSLPDPSIDDRQTALGHFKDWSNYLLVSTVAAIGWIAQSKIGHRDVLELSVWCFGLSLIFGILTLALIPLIAEQLRDQDKSIYQVQARFSFLRRPREAYLTQACRPQHLLFMIGVIVYAIAVTAAEPVTNLIASMGLGPSVVGLLVVTALAGYWSKPRSRLTTEAKSG